MRNTAPTRSTKERDREFESEVGLEPIRGGGGDQGTGGKDPENKGGVKKEEPISRRWAGAGLMNPDIL